MLLEVSDLGFRYPDGLLALDGLSFRLAKQEVLAIVGPSGCGKSTLLSLLARLQLPSDGKVEWNESAFLSESDGRGLVCEEDRQRSRRSSKPKRRRLSLVFQRDTLLPWLTVEQNVALGLEYVDLSPGERAERITSLLELVNLSDEFRRAYPKQLSGGMRRRVALLTGIAPLPHLVLLDEPFSALDEPTRVSVHEDLLQMIYRLGLSVILITHDVAEAITLSDRILILTDRPARVARVIKTNLGRTRDIRGLRETPEYQALYAEAWHELWHQAGKA